MTLNISVKQLSKRRNLIDSRPFCLDFSPTTVKELIFAVVSVCVAEYNARFFRGDRLLKPLSDEEISERAVFGKIAFGINYGKDAADLAQAQQVALSGFEDGLYRIFIGTAELRPASVDEKITLSDGDTLTFVRLVMLSGRLF